MPSNPKACNKSQLPEGYIVFFKLFQRGSLMNIYCRTTIDCFHSSLVYLIN